MGIPARFKRLRVQNQSNDVAIADINTLVVPDTWLQITGPDEATLIVGDVDSLTSLTNITIDADTDANGSGTIALRTRNLNRLVINNDGTANLLQNDLLIGTFNGGNSGGRVRLATDSAAIYAAFSEATFDYVGTGPGGASYSNHSFGLWYNSDFSGAKVVASEVSFGLNHEPKFSQAGNPYQTEIYYSWTDPTNAINIRPWGLVIQHATGDTVLNMNGEIAFLENLSSGGTQTALWHETGFLEFTNGATAQIQFPNNAPSIVGYNAAASATIGMIKVNASDKVVVDPGGFGTAFGGLVTVGQMDANEIRSVGDTDTLIEFPGSNILRFHAGGAVKYRIDTTGLIMNSAITFDADNTFDFGIVSGTNFRPRDIKAGRDLYVGGTVLIAGLTAGSVLFAGASGLISQDNGSLFFDDTNNRLGIGTASPNAKLSVHCGDTSASGTGLQILSDTTGTTVNDGFTMYNLADDIYWNQRENKSLFIYVNSTNLVVTMSPAGSFIVGPGSLATTATAGFLYIASCAGVPTGVPTAFTGEVAMVYDRTNNHLYIYNGGWKKTTVFA